MIKLLFTGGWLMLPLLACSILALAIVLERLWSLKIAKQVPNNLVPNILHQLNNINGSTSANKLIMQHKNSALGKILLVGLQYANHGVDNMRNQMENRAKIVMVDLEKYLNSLGTIAQVAPLLGLLGTVVGMIQVFTVLTQNTDPNIDALADGISKALLTTAFGLMVAIPSLVFHRFFQRKLEELACAIELQGKIFLDGLLDLANKNKQK